jgi:predicted nucleic acid-binding protein
MTLVDSDVLLDLFFRDPVWFHWSKTMLARRSETGPLAIVDVTFSEVALGFAHAADVELALEALAIARMPMTGEALHAAAQAFKRYRLAGGRRGGVLPHFLVGACAQTAGLPILTRDRRYGEHFPGVELITP